MAYYDDLEEMYREDLRRDDLFDRQRRQRELNRICNPWSQDTDVADDYMEDSE
jgi:hypothetical protein